MIEAPILIQHVDLLGPSGLRVQPDFEHSPDFNRRWWNESRPNVGNPTYLRANIGGVELARLEVLRDFPVDQWGPGSYARLPILVIERFEIAAGRQCQGYGRRVLVVLEEFLASHQLAASVLNTDGFWEKVGWRRLENRERPRTSSPLYLSEYHRRSSRLR